MPNTPAHYAVLYQETISDAVTSGASMMGQLIAALRSGLQAKEASARDLHERDLYAESLKQLFLHDEALRSGFGRALQEQFSKSQAAPEVTAPHIADVPFDQLELMDELQVQASVNMARSQQMALLSAEANLSELNTLVCATLGLPSVQPERNPLRPDSFIAALRTTVERIAVPHGLHQDWLDGMGVALGGELKALYARLTAKLHDAGAVAAAYVLTSTRGTGAAGGAGPAPAPDPSLLTLDRLRKLLAGELAQLGANQRVATFSEHFSQKFDAQVHWNTPADAAHTDFASTVPAAFEALADMQQVDHVMQRLQARQGAGKPVTDAAGADAVREQIRRSASGVAQALSLEVVNLMVDNMARDPRLLKPVQALVRALEPALMRLVLVDARIFTDKQHAARVLIQEITSRSLAYPSVKAAGFAEFMGAVRDAVAPLSNAAPDGPELFRNALDQLRGLWQQESAQQAQARTQAVKALEKAEQRNLLAEKIAREIDSHPDAAKVSEAVLAFLCGPWAQVVAQARMSGGSGSAAADKYQALVSAMLWSAHPDLAHKNITKLTKLVPLLLATLREGLDTIQYPPTKTSAFLEVLMGLHQAAFRAVQRDTATILEKSAPRIPSVASLVRQRPVQDGNPWVAPAEAQDSNLMDIEDAPLQSLVNPAPNQASAPGAAPAPVGPLPLGAWVELQTNGEWIRTQMTWASPHGTLFLFTNAAGATHSMTRRTHDRLVALGQLKVISALPVMDDALDAVAHKAMQNSVDSTL
ncbi:DUF1631 family protein [Rhodoferax sp. OV413]|uniref:DUF1631 family protein n=1 Tax=Rhodoferax sp. OV413 TaxID=1855285 RepID=UPI0025D26586|nr:DUF1631 family protein [Rhodoferax sp. OV413]